MESKEKQLWECASCHQREGVINGICPSCGPCQTIPVNDEAKKEAGVVEPIKKETKEDEGQSTKEV